MAGGETVNLTVRIQGTAQGFVNAAKAAANALKPIDTAIRKTNQSFNSLSKKGNVFLNQINGAKQLGNSYKGLVGQVTSLNRGFNILSSSVRQVGQGFQNFGTTLSIFLSLPLGAFIRGAVKDAMSFNNAMIEVRKTTGLAGKDLDRLSKLIREGSLESPTDPTTLAEIGAAWGRMGVSGVDNIAKLVQATDKLQIATTLTADQAVSDLGRIGNIFYDTAQEFVDNYENLGSAINELGQANAVTENEIVAAALRMAPAAKSMGMEVEALLALATTAAATNASAERAGTQTASAISKSVIELEKVSELTGISQENIAAMIRDDPEKYFLDLAYSLSQVDDPLTRIIGSTEIFGVTGAKSVQSLAAAFPTLAKNLAISNKAYADGISLQMEYDRALDSVQTQVGILRNNIRYLSTSIADVLLPYITKFAALAIPAVQLVVAAFEQLTEKNKLLVVGIGLLLTIVGPLLVALGSLLFSIGIIATGFTAFITFIGTATSSLLGFAGTILGLIAPFKAFIVAIGGAAIAIYTFGEQLGGVAKVVRDYINKAYSWGYNLIASFASGIMDAASLIYNTMVSVINSFIGLIQAFSPPREGPLSQIQEWGKNTMTAFMDGMADIDTGVMAKAVGGIADTLRGLLEGFDFGTFEIFEDLWGTLESTIGSVASSVGLAGNELKDFLKGAATQLASLLERMRSGELSSAVGQLSLGGFLGEFQGDIEKLVDLQFQYGQLEDSIRDAEDALQSLNSTYGEQIEIINASADINANEAAATIRQLLVQKAIKEDSIKKDKDKLDILGDQIKQQEGILSILTSFLPDAETGGAGGIAGSIKDTKDSIEDLKDSLGSFDLQDASGALDELGQGALSDLADKFDDAGEKAETFISKIQRARDVVAGFIAALRGEEFSPEQLQALGEAFTLGFEKGAEIRDTILNFLSEVNKYYTSWLLFLGFIATAFSIIKQGVMDAIGVINGTSVGNESIEQFKESYQKLYNLLYKTGVVIGNIAKKLTEMGNAFIANIDPDGTLTTRLKELKTPLESIARLLGGIALLVFDNLDDLSGIIGTILGYTGQGLVSLIALGGVLAEIVLISAGHGSVKRLADNLDLMWEGAGKFAGDINQTLANIKGFAQSMKDMFTVEAPASWETTINAIKTISSAVVQFAQDWANLAMVQIMAFMAFIQGIVTGFGEISKIDAGVSGKANIIRGVFNVLKFVYDLVYTWTAQAIEALYPVMFAIGFAIGKIASAVTDSAVRGANFALQVFNVIDTIYGIAKNIGVAAFDGLKTFISAIIEGVGEISGLDAGIVIAAGYARAAIGTLAFAYESAKGLTIGSINLLKRGFDGYGYIYDKIKDWSPGVWSIAKTGIESIGLIIGMALGWAIEGFASILESVLEAFKTIKSVYDIVVSIVTGETSFSGGISQIATAFKTGADNILDALNPWEKVKESVQTVKDAYDKMKEVYQNISNLSFMDGGEADGGTLTPEITIEPNITASEETGNAFTRFWNGLVGNSGPDEETLNQTSTAVAARVGTSMETSLTNIPTTTYDPIATNLQTWAEGDGAAVIEESSIGLANSLGLGIETALGENYLFWNGLIASFNAWWDESGFAWASETAAPLVFNTINDKIYELFDTMMPTYQRIIFAYRKWYNATKVTLVNIGKEIATRITDGIREIFDDADAYMNNMVAAMKSWITRNEDKLKEIGKEIGKIIGKAIVDEIEDKLDDLMDKYSSPPSGGGGGGTSQKSTSSAAPAGFSIPSVSLPQVTTPINSQPNMNFNVTINGNVDDDRRAREMADEIYRRIALDMRYA